jgi:mono/diheme cytochrome c family protein
MKHPSKIVIASSLFFLGTLLGYAAPAADNWDNHCAKCHGADGKGQTKIGKKLALRDYTDAAVQAEFKDEALAKDIAEGVKDKNGKEKMKAFSPELSSEEIQALVAYIRKFKA